MNIDDTLEERGKRYGEYKTHADITQGIKSVMNATTGWSRLAPHMKETLDMLAHKIGRILNGDPNYHDSWHDIVGYAKLTADEVLKEPQIGEGNTKVVSLADHIEKSLKDEVDRRAGKTSNVQSDAFERQIEETRAAPQTAAVFVVTQAEFNQLAGGASVQDILKARARRPS